MLAALICAGAAQAGISPEIRDTGVLGGVGEVTNVRFAPNGEVFAIDKEGQIFNFPSLAEPNNEVIVADLSSEVMDYEDRGLLGLAIDPEYPVRPYIYVLYAYDAPPGETAPVWPNKECLTPPGPGPEFGVGGGDGCVVTGRLSRITVDLSTHKMLGEEHPLIKDEWCQQFTSHSVGDLQFGSDGSLYASGGSGGAFELADWGQYGGTLPDKEHPLVPANPCGDPNEESIGAGTPGVTAQELPTAEGGVLRSQSFRRPASQPASLDGTIARVDPDTGEPLPNNPNIAASDLNRKRTVAYGLRQPFRFTFRPGTEELWVGDVGENKWEEINRDASPLSAPSKNFGWPCFEGSYPEGEENLPYEYGVQYEKANLCKRLYTGEPEANTAVHPYFAYNHGAPVLAGDECPYHHAPPAPPDEAGASISGLAFLHGGPWPQSWDGALLFGDVTRDCIWAMMPEASGEKLPDPSNIVSIESLSEGKGIVCENEPVTQGCPVDLELGPEGDIYYADINSGSIRRLSYEGYPVAVIGTSAPLIHAGQSLAFNGSSSTSPDPGATYQWEFGDGATASTADPSHTYATAGTYTVTLVVSDVAKGTHDATSVKVTVLTPEPPPREEEVVAPPVSTPTPVQPLPAPVAPVLSGVTLKPARFRAAPKETLRKVGGKGASAIGATLGFKITQKASLKLTFARGVSAGKGLRYKSITTHGVVSICTGGGHRRKCRSPKSNRIVVSVGAGTDRVVLSGWAGGVALPAGAYSITVQAVGANMIASSPIVVHFTILSPTKR